MLPHVHVFGLHIPMYTLMLAVGLVFFFTLFVYYFRAEYRGDRVTFNRLTFSTCLSVVTLAITAFLFDTLFHSISEGVLTLGGITWLGGVVGAFPAVLIFTHLFVPKKRGYELDILDNLIPGVAIAHAFGRVGCFLGGCCFGRLTDSALGVSFPAGSPAAELYPGVDGGASLPVLPTQLFEAVFELILFVTLFFVSRKTRKYNTAIWSIAYGIFRFLLEFLRGDDRGSAVFSLSPAQILSIFLFVFGVLVLLLRRGLIFHRLTAVLEQWREQSDSLPILSYDEVSGSRVNSEILLELYRLKEKGIITEEEYEKKKSEISERI